MVVSIVQPVMVHILFSMKADMASPQIELGMMFATAKSFRTVVQQQHYRKAVVQCRNFGKKVKYWCKGQDYT